MKIIKPGNVALLDLIMIGKCPRCKCEFECNVSETRAVNDPRESDVEYFINCPTIGCGQEVPVRVRTTI